MMNIEKSNNSGTTSTKGDNVRAFFDRRHPMYQEMLPHWIFLRESYKGGRRWFEENLHRYLKEGDREFEDRRVRAYRFNHTREVVELVQKYLFKGSINRNKEEAPEEIKTFWESAMLNGFDIGQLMRQIAVNSSVGGRIALVVDNNFEARYDEDGKKIASTVSDANGSRVYAYTVAVEDILDYAWDEEGDGQLLWIKLLERVRDDFDPIHSTGLVTERVRLWTRTEWFLYNEVAVEKTGSKKESRVDLVDLGRHDLGFVPVRLVDHTVSSDPYHCGSLIDDIAYLDRAVANYLSNLDAIIQDQTFSQLAMPAQSIQRGDDTYAKLMEMGTKRMFVYDSGQSGSAKPEFISPDPKQAGVILTVINKVINEIYHTVGLAGERTKEDNAVGIDNSSGVAKAYDFEKVNSLLKSKAASCEGAENWMNATVMAWHGKPDAQKYVSYPETFDVMRLVDELVTSEALQKVEAPIEMRRQQMRVLVNKLFPQLKEDIRKSMLLEIDTWEPQSSKEPQPSESKPVAAPDRQGSVTPD